jgi:hypothetical protein
MRSELRSIPRKTALEAVLYFLLGAYVLLVAPRLAGAMRGRRMPRSARIVAMLLPGALFFVLAAAPLLIWSYGYGGFTNLVGPGAISYSGPYFRMQSWFHNASNSVSYRAFVSPLILPPGVMVELCLFGLRALPLVGDAFGDGLDSNWPYWLAGALFYGGIGAAIGAAKGRLRPREPSRSI